MAEEASSKREAISVVGFLPTAWHGSTALLITKLDLRTATSLQNDVCEFDTRC